jgi:hypothetical protein
MSAPKDQTGKDIVVGDYLIYIDERNQKSHIAKLVSIGADGTLTGIRLANSKSNMRIIANSIPQYQFDRLIKTYDFELGPMMALDRPNAGQPETLQAAKDYIKVSVSGGAGRRRKTRKSKRRNRKTRRSRK